MTSIPLDPSAGAHVISGMIRRGEALPTPPPPAPEVCGHCGQEAVR